MSFKDLPGGKNSSKNKNASAEFSKEISPQSSKDKNASKCK